MDRRRSTGVLVTGGNGFVGSYVARALAQQGRSVCVLDEKPLSVATRFVLGELADRIAVEIGSVADWSRCAEVMQRYRPRHLIHLAVAGAPFSKDLHANLSVNVIGTVNVLELARLLDVERVVLFSSEVVVPSVRYIPVDPAHPVILPREGPRGGFYGASKLANEAFAFAYRDNHGLDIRIIRPTAVYGQGMTWQTYVKVMVEGAVRGEAVRFDHGASFEMDYTHVEDVAGLAVTLLDAPPDADNVFYSSTGAPPVNNAELAEIVMAAVPGSEITVGHGLDEEQRNQSGSWAQISIDNAKEQLGWTPTYASMRDGVESYTEHYRAFLRFMERTP